jgi:hypothetical protein
MNTLDTATPERIQRINHICDDIHLPAQCRRWATSCGAADWRELEQSVKLRLLNCWHTEFDHTDTPYAHDPDPIRASFTLQGWANTVARNVFHEEHRTWSKGGMKSAPRTGFQVTHADPTITDAIAWQHEEGCIPSLRLIPNDPETTARKHAVAHQIDPFGDPDTVYETVRTCARLFFQAVIRQGGLAAGHRLLAALEATNTDPMLADMARDVLRGIYKGEHHTADDMKALLQATRNTSNPTNPANGTRTHARRNHRRKATR